MTVVDRHGIAAGASGRNSGVLQHPLDPALADWHLETLALYRSLEGFPLSEEPDGILLLGALSTDGLPPEVRPELLSEARELEPLVLPGIPAVRVDTGWVVGPRSATEAWAARARRSGAQFLTDAVAPEAPQTLIATGAWTDGVEPLWGVTATTKTRSGHVLEEAGVEGITDLPPGEIFTLCGDLLGSSFHPGDEPDAQAVARKLQQHARRFIGDIEIVSARACPRPRPKDGRLILERRDERTVVCAGHGPWGISIGPATARAAADLIRSGA